MQPFLAPKEIVKVQVYIKLNWQTTTTTPQLFNLLGNEPIMYNKLMPENGQIQGGASVENLPNLNVHASITVLGS